MAVGVLSVGVSHSGHTLLLWVVGLRITWGVVYYFFMCLGGVGWGAVWL